MSSAPISPYRAQQVSKWKCASCGNYNSLKKKKCPKCNSKNTQMSFDDIEMLHELEEAKTEELNRKSFTKNSKYLQKMQNRWIKNVIKNRSLKIMHNESNQNPCVSLQQCPSAKRAVFIQNLYRNWCIAHQSIPSQKKKRRQKRKTLTKPKKNQKKKSRRKAKSGLTTLRDHDVYEHTLPPTMYKQMDKPSMSIADIICKLLKNYNVSQLIEDCNHIDVVHAADPDRDTTQNKNYNKNKKRNHKYLKIFKFFQSELGECKPGKCNIFSRSNRNRANDSDTFNRSRIYYGFVNAKDVSVITTLDTFHTFWFHSYNLYKIDAEKSYKTLRSLDDDDDNGNDNENELKENKHQNENDIYNKKKINGHGLNININNSSINNINSSKFITTTTTATSTSTSTFIDDNKEEKQNKHFEFGEHFEYWQFYSKYDNFIPKTYSTLKEELLNNNISSIDKIIFDDITCKVDLLIQTSTIRKMKAIRNFYNEIAQIKENDIITKQHLICIMIYTNHNEIQRKYKETLRLDLLIGNTNINYGGNNDQKFNHEKYIELKKRNSQISNWCRLLFESVRFWGTIMTEKDAFFHGIDTTLLFDKFYAAFKCPISTSTNICVAQSFKDNKEGIIIKVSCASEKSMIPFLDVSFISDFRMESERLFYGADLNIIDIYYKKLRFDYMLRALSLFQCIVSGGFFTHNKKLINVKNQKRLISLIENYLKYHNKTDLIYEKTKKIKSKKNQKNQKKTEANAMNKQSKKQPPVFKQRPLSKVKSGPNVTDNIYKVKKNQKRTFNNNNTNNNSSNKHRDKELEEKEEKKENKIVSISNKKKRKYHHQLFDFCISSRQNSDIWLCRTEILATDILYRLQKYFINFNENSDEILPGNFVKFWKFKWNINIKYSQEFDWEIKKKNLDTFFNLKSGDLIQSPRYLYTLINNESLSDIQFYAECCRWSKDDPGWTDFYWNVEKLPSGVSEIQVIIDVCCQEDNNKKQNQNKNSEKNKRIISHDIYEGEWMSTVCDEQSYFGGKAFPIVEEFYDTTQITQYDDNDGYNSEPMSVPPKIISFRWKMSIRVSTIAYTPVHHHVVSHNVIS